MSLKPTRSARPISQPPTAGARNTEATAVHDASDASGSGKGTLPVSRRGSTRRIIADRSRPIEARTEARLRESLTISRQAFPQGHVQIQTTENILGGCLTSMKRYAEAEPLLTSSYAVIAKQAGTGHPRTQAALNRVIQLYEAWDKPTKATEWRAKLPKEGAGAR